jgi:arylsulfatase A-like enzyme
MMIVGVGVLSFSSCHRDAPPPASPNVVLISVDSLRPDHLQCYGYHRPTSPRVDQLAAEGVLFENTISSTSWTLPAHAAMLTGLADTVHGCTDTDKQLDNSRQTLAERLADVGYKTAGYFSGPYLHPVFGTSQGFETYVDCTSYPQFNNSKAQSTGSIEGPDVWRRAQHDITNPKIYQEVNRWLKQNSSQTFFLFIHMWDVHFDFVPPPPYDTMFDPGYTGTMTGEDFLFSPRVKPGMPESDLQHLIALYDGEIACTDAYIGKVLDNLEVLGLADNTILLLTADHGTAFFEHGLKAHRNSLYDELIRVPLIIRYPKRIPAGLRFKEQVKLIDIVPTILDMLGMARPVDVMGQSLTPLFHGGKLNYDQPAVSELFSFNQKMRSYRQVDRKLIVNRKHKAGVAFNLLNDPAEQSPIQDRHGVLMQALQRDSERSLKWLAEFREALPPGRSTSEIPPELLQKLKSLGYIGGEED